MIDDIFAAIDEHNDRASSEARIWNLFAQILIPLVILITFVAVDGIRRYGEYLQNEQILRGIAEHGRTQCEMTRNQACTPERNQAWALNQWQKMLLQLNGIMQQQRAELGLSHFRNSDDVHLDGVTVNDPNFQKLDEAAAQQLETGSAGRQKLIEGIYLAIIKAASLHDQTSPVLDTAIRQAEDQPMGGDPEDFDLAGDSVDQNVIIPQIRQRFLSRIAAECNILRDDVEKLQIATVGRVYHALNDAPEQLTATERQYAARMLEQGISAGERSERAREFYHRFNDDLRDRLTVQHYVFLQETWSALNAYQ